MLDMSVSPIVPTNDREVTEKRRKWENYVRSCELKLPEEVAELFIANTRWIWEYKCIGAINKFYNDDTIVHSDNNVIEIGSDAVIAGSLQTLCAYPDKINNFVDIFVEGDEENGYCFGQLTRQPLVNLGWSKYGEPTGKFLGVGDTPLLSICELFVKKIDGRWRVTEEWVMEGTEIKRQTLNADRTVEAKENDSSDSVLSKELAAKAAEAAVKAAEAAAEAANAATKIANSIATLVAENCGGEEEQS